ncbi:MAG: radical SAM protein [Anaerolineales bacterium]|nr:radical SAM protein [Anaerolineales bacterium]
MANPNGQLIIVWRVYEPCNLSCHFCGYSREIVRKRHVTGPDVMLSFGKVLSEFQEKTGKEVVVSWLGGEPLLWKELPAISHTYRQDFKIKLGLTTNGTLLPQENIRRDLIDDYSLVTISIDGFAEFHDLHRGEKGLFEKIKRHVPELIKEIDQADSALKLRVNTILMRENLNDFEAFCMEMAGWGIKELTFNQLGGIDRPQFYPDNRLLPEQAVWFANELPQIQKKAAAKGLKIFSSHHYLQRIIASSNNTAIPVDDCGPGRSFLFINEENLVSPCNFTTEGYGIPLSELQNLDALMELPARFHDKQQNERAAPCRDCHSTQVFEKFIAPEIQNH